MKGGKNKKKRTGREALLRETADKGDWPERLPSLIQAGSRTVLKTTDVSWQSVEHEGQENVQITGKF